MNTLHIYAAQYIFLNMLLVTKYLHNSTPPPPPPPNQPPPHTHSTYTYDYVPLLFQISQLSVSFFLP